MVGNDNVRLVEVGPRDGLQNEKTTVSARDKIALIDLLTDSGLQNIESGSFVSPKWVPQMANTAEVFAGISRQPGVRYSALTPNMRGLQDALQASASEIAVFLAVTESFSQKNINCSIEESLQRALPVIEAANNAGVPVRGYLSCVLGCPYEGAVDNTIVHRLTSDLLQAGCYEVSLGDTIGVGTAGSATKMLKTLTSTLPAEKLAVHFHDTYGQALANIHAALGLGIRVIDSAIAGLGGCPYAKGATGNVATEDVLYMLEGLGLQTGVDMHKLLVANQFICEKLQRESASRVATALLQKR